MLTEEQRKKLNAMMPAEEVSTRKGGGGKALSYIEGWRVIQLMNEFIGAGAWGYSCDATEAVRELSDDGDKGKRWHVTHTSRCVLSIEGCQPIADYGVGHGVEKDLGAAIESSIKEAATDSLKRCIKSLGNRVGLAVYDKEQRGVGEEPQPQQLSPKGEEVVAALVKARSDAEWSAATKTATAEWKNLNGADKQAINAVAAERKKVA